MTIFQMQDIPARHRPAIGALVDIRMYREGELTSMSIYPIWVKTKSKQPRLIKVKTTIHF